jgi:hypothetical protein
VTDASPWPDDVGAYCPDVPDAISLLDFAGERARESQYRLSEDTAFAELIAAFWRGEFDDLRTEGAVFTLERFHAASAEQLWSDTELSKDTLARRAVYWTAREYAGFIAQFWYVDQSDNRLPEFASDDERLRWLAALRIIRYPKVARGLLERLHISRTDLRSWVQRPPAGERSRPRGRQREYWPDAERELLEWLDEEGEPETLAEAEGWLAENLQAKGHHPATSTIRIHATRCIDMHRARRRATRLR